MPFSAAPALGELRYETMPFGQLEEQAAVLSRPLTLTVTCSPKHGVERTLDVGHELRAMGHTVVVHVAARMVRGRGHVDEILGRMSETGIHDLFLVGGDREKSLGPFRRGLDLLPVLKAHANAPRSIGIPAYPEGHPRISHPSLAADLRQKSELADYMTTQMCFSAPAIAGWLRALREQGIELPAIIGIPGTIDRERLFQVALQVGVGTSTSYLRKQHGAIGKLFGHCRPAAEQLYGTLAPMVGGELGIAGLHVFTFNRLVETVRFVDSQPLRPSVVG